MDGTGSDWRRPDRPIGYGRQSIDEADVRAVADVLRGDWLTQGPAIGAFEDALVRETGAAEAVAVNSGTAALHLSLLGLGIGPGDRVVTSANTFLASATAALHCGAEAEFVDVELEDGNLSCDALERRLCSGPPVAAVVAVSFAGLACDFERLARLKTEHGFRLVVDACHALGGHARVDGEPRRVGEVPGVDAAALSFHPVKHVTTGEGGAVLTSDAALAARVRRLREHGLVRDPERRPFRDSAGPAPWFSTCEELGYNYRLPDFCAALGTSQLARLDELVAARRRIAAAYDAELEGWERLARDDGHAWHLYVVRAAAEERDELMTWLRAGGIGTQLHYYPVPLQPLFRERPGAPADPEAAFPAAVEHARRSLSLPLHPGLAEADRQRVVAALSEWRRSG